MTGPAERELDRLGLFYAVVIRSVVIALSSLTSLLTATPRHVLPAALIILGFNAWNAFFAVTMLRRAPKWLPVVDVLVIAGVCLAQVWTASPEMLADRVSWTLVAASVIVVAYQFHSSIAAGAAITLVILVAYLTGGVLAELQDWSVVVPNGLWIAVEAALGRGLYLLVRRGGRDADGQFARGEQVRREATVATARREDEREYLAALHDTASATLLMVSAGVAKKPEKWLSEQAMRDLEVISGHTDPSDGEVDLVEMLPHVVEHVPLKIEWHLPESLPMPAMVGVAFSRGAREALTNVIRHAGVHTAEVGMARDGNLVRVRIRDEGKGFDPSRITGGHGVTGSLVERMARMGGRAVVNSEPGKGTEIILEWPDERA